METNGSGTEYNTMSRLGEVDPEECDALADVFLGASPRSAVDRTDEQEPDEAGPKPRVLQLVIGGHLPDAEAVFTRFCQSESVEPDRAVGCVHHVGAGWSARLIGRGHRFHGRRATVAHAMSQVSAAADRVNILLPPHHEVGRLIDGLDELSDPPDSVVVLSTADESDVVAAYRQIKSIVAFSRGHLERTRVVLVDEPGPEAQAALNRLLDTAARFLNAPLGGSILPLRDPDAVEASGVPADETSPTDDPRLGAEAAEPEPGGSSPELRSAPEASAEAPSSSESTEPEPEPDDESLVAQLTEGLSVLSIRCPEAPGVVFAVDAEGRVHAFAATQDIGDLRAQPDPLAALTRARAFIARHMPVLEPLEPRIRSAAGPVVGHLVSDRFGALEPCLRTDLRLHLVVAVRAAGRTVWGIRELAAD